MSDERLERFHRAQDSYPGFDQALAEIESGQKQGHWIWYILPQLEGLGQSRLSVTYAIADRSEAEAYLQDAALRHRYMQIASAVAAQIKRGVGVQTVMGSDVDAQKLVSSLTLFGDVADDLFVKDALPAYATLAGVVRVVLTAAAREGYPPCTFTLKRLERR